MNSNKVDASQEEILQSILKEIQKLSLKVENLQEKVNSSASKEAEDSSSEISPIYLKKLEDDILNFFPVYEEKKSTYSSILVVRHPKRQDIRMLLAMNHFDQEKFSLTAIEEMRNWFSSISLEQVIDFFWLEDAFARKFHDMLRIFSSFSVSGVVIDSSSALVIGFQEGEIYLCRDGEIFPLELSSPSFSTKIIKNQDFDSILLLSGGNKENLEDDQVKIVTSSTNRDELARKILESTAKIGDNN